MPANMVQAGSNLDPQPYGNVVRPPWKTIKYSGNFGATEASETMVAIIDATPYRSICFSTQATSWGSATVLLKIYSCDDGGNTNANPFFTRTLIASDASPVLLYLSDAIGPTAATTPWPPTAATTGLVPGPFGNFVKITEQCTVFSSGTNTVSLTVLAKG